MNPLDRVYPTTPANRPRRPEDSLNKRRPDPRDRRQDNERQPSGPTPGDTDHIIDDFA